MKQLFFEFEEEKKRKLLEEKKEDETLSHYFLRKKAEQLGLFCPVCERPIWRIKKMSTGYVHVNGHSCGGKLSSDWVEENKDKLIVEGV